MKIKIKEEIYRKHLGDNYAEIRFSDLPKDIIPSDIISIEREDSYHSEKESYDAYTDLVVLRERDETDEEQEKRRRENEEFTNLLKEQRRETYLKLKKEFEN